MIKWRERQLCWIALRPDVIQSANGELPSQVTGLSLDTFLQKSAAHHMTRSVRTVTRDVTIHELGELFSASDFNSYPVEDNARVVGIVSKFDILANFMFTPTHMVPQYQDLMKRTVGDIMTPDFIYVGTDTKLTRVLQLMVDHRLRSMPVIETDQHLVGMISRQDLIRALQSDVGETSNTAT